MKEKENVALFDLDGTLANYEKSLRKELDLIKSPDEVYPEDLWNGAEWLENRMSMIKKTPGFWSNLEKIKAGFEVLETAYDVGFENMILTKGPRKTHSAWTEKVIWCENNIDEDYSVTITHDKGLVYGRVLCDDWPPYIKRWLEWRPRGLVIMLDWHYNKDFNHSNVFRYKQNLKGANWVEQMDQLKEALEKAYTRPNGSV